jgi:hypothetical protein
MSRSLMFVTIPTTTLGLLVVVVHSLFFDDGPLVWQGLKLLVCGVLLAANVLALSLLFSPIATRPSSRLAAIAGGSQIGLGAMAFDWTLHLSISTGDFEGAVATLSALFVLQGFLLLAQVVPGRRPRAQSS